jgi:hypothetical protein
MEGAAGQGGGTPGSGTPTGSGEAAGLPAAAGASRAPAEPPTQLSGSAPAGSAAPSRGQGAAPAPAGSPTQPSGSPPAGSRGQDAAAGDDAPVYLREAPLPGGGTLRLSGIAWRPDFPAAVVNGEVLIVGEGVEGYSLVAVDRDRVRLRGAAGELVIRLP